MKKFIFVLFSFFLLIVLVFQFLNTSTTSQLDTDNLTYKNDYTTNSDIVPEDDVGAIALSFKNNIKNNFEYNFSGLYIKEKITLSFKEIFNDYKIAPKYMWTNSDRQKALCFYNNTLYIIDCLTNKITSEYNFVYNDSQLQLTDVNGYIFIYLCDFKYYYEKLDDIVADRDEIIDTEVVEHIDSEDENISDLERIFKHPVIVFLCENIFEIIIFSALPTFLMFLFLKNHISYILYKKYKEKLKSKLFLEEHSWYGDNNPIDIYVSAKIFEKGTYEEYDLLQFFSASILNKTSNYVILGNAGEGKTFSLYRLTLAILECFSYSKSCKKEYKKFKKLVPVFLNFIKLSKCNDNEEIIELIYEKIFEVADIKNTLTANIFGLFKKEKIIKKIERYLLLGKFVILIDGYDELNSQEKRLETSRVVIDFMNEYRGCNFIMTSRTQIYENEQFSNINSEHMLYLSPLSKDKIHKFISKWKYPKGKSYYDLYNKIINSQQIEEMVTNPLLLTMITHTYSNSETIEFQTKTKLYKDCCECLLSKWQEKKFLVKRIYSKDTIGNIQIKLELLSLLAFELFTTRQKHLEEKDIIDLWNNSKYAKGYFNGQTKNVLYEFVANSGIIEKTDNCIKFHHNSFYEYFVALYMMNNNYDIKKLYYDIRQNSQILFYYFSMGCDENIVNEFISNNLKNIKLLSNIILERKISNNHIVNDLIIEFFNNMNFADINDTQTIGYIAQKYPVFISEIERFLTKKLLTTFDPKERVNIIISLMSFSNKKSFRDLYNALDNKLNLKTLIDYSGESINEHVCEIVNILNPDEKYEFIEELAKSFRFEAIYNLYLSEKVEIKYLGIAGLLYLTKESELLNLLHAKKFFEMLDETSKIAIKEFSGKYPWKKHMLSDDAINNLFALIYLGGQAVFNEIKLNPDLIENKVNFLICSYISESKNEVYFELLKIDSISIKSIIELNYHWNLNSMGKRMHFKQGLVDAVAINRVINIAYFMMVVVMMLFTIFSYININEITIKNWEVDESAFDFSLILFDSLYLISLGSIYFAIKFVFYMFKKIDYSKVINFLYLSVSFIFDIIFNFLTFNMHFRIIFYVFSLINCGLEILKHKNNYPSFREPQYSKIVNYLNDEYNFNDIYVG